MNLFGALRRSFFEIFNSFQSTEKNQKKNDGKTEIFTQNQFSTKLIFLYGCNSKTNHCKYLKFSLNVYVSVIYIDSNFYEICRKRENLQYKTVNKIFLAQSKYLKIIIHTVVITHHDIIWHYYEKNLYSEY
ncbi:Uncharacterized protein FWK35_00014471 [Aphis craccivora]|uniref:Uncharacterized protein n=1 Tax=Aphis craccivora TaxID=307492 RepID=A0A6G0Y0I9_APHCR|nr:Uncharacterized protein FWK35_00014471 [Aphis craccivora]